jgi:hypothetical protein
MHWELGLAQRAAPRDARSVMILFDASGEN